MLVDFPDYTRDNLWQVKTIQTCAPVEVKCTTAMKFYDCDYLHISWEDYFFVYAKTESDADRIITAFDDHLSKQCKRSKLIWTWHDLGSNNHHVASTFGMPVLNRMRQVIMRHVDLIILMSEKHRFLVPAEYQDKVRILPHYIERNPYENLPRNSMPTLFRYGDVRDVINQEDYVRMLFNPKIRKLIADPRLPRVQVIDTDNEVMLGRRLSCMEASLYARLANFAYFYRNPQLNSGVINFLIGNKLAVFHNPSAFKYFDVPEVYANFAAEKFDPEKTDFEACWQIMADHDAELEDFIEARSPEKTSAKFWQYLSEL